MKGCYFFCQFLLLEDHSLYNFLSLAFPFFCTLVSIFNCWTIEDLIIHHFLLHIDSCWHKTVVVSYRLAFLTSVLCLFLREKFNGWHHSIDHFFTQEGHLFQLLISSFFNKIIWTPILFPYNFTIIFLKPWFQIFYGSANFLTC